ncbi:Methionyl-tRNA formyltransferase, mitochondrial [Lachnellula willkommii]|uniref:methionyl-tRNA formyltransferase n=1 Tax=Lachnellula willkommii TaxID=215461 RepID=A0A559M424_9HELO|nr:Methionyl-tRNA formyltransferase, mitochondrial [Lachnellula willkommii]
MKLLLPFRTLQYVSRSCPSGLNIRGRRWYTSKVSKPLRILFCGSDEFSCASLRALQKEQHENPQLIASIDVMCRPGKKSGRSMTKIREVPIKAVAQELGLPIHERDTFTGWELPKPQNESINIIIAVSFGLFVPPRILKSAEYGGLNVHPSLLPDLRGPAPLQHTIINRLRRTGVTLQTLDEKAFDHGIILAQTPRPGLAIPNGEICTYYDLLRWIKPQAAQMLVEGLRDRVFVPPLVDVGKHDINPKPAPKITKEDTRIKAHQWGQPVDIFAHYRALGRLWALFQSDDGSVKRVILEDIEMLPVSEIPDDAYIWQPVPQKSDPSGQIHKSTWEMRGSKKQDAIYLRYGGVVALRVNQVTIEGEKKKAATVLSHL